MKQILVYANGGRVVIDSDSSDQALINGEQPEIIVPASDENMRLYFPDLKPPKPETAIKL